MEHIRSQNLIFPNINGRIITCAITDRSHYGATEVDREAGILRQAKNLARNSTDFIQLREKDLNPQTLLRLARSMIETLRNAHSQTLLILNSGNNSRVDIAAAAGAEGLHLTSGDGTLTPGQAGRILRSAGARKPVISVSCHSAAEVRQAREDHADIILFGPVFGKFIDGRLVVPGKGLDLLAEACSEAGATPVLALGGITLENAASCLDAGARGIAAIRLFQQLAE